MVGVARFELAAPCSQNRCANRTALYPDNCKVIIPIVAFHRNLQPEWDTCAIQSLTKDNDHHGP